ncbi:hypothetical protein ABI59_08880 [Acidobacteria bacterium Mor1]|nr:hypothetical protein ABI59_08880 [Acidobacteria bacterium Mor1]
MKKFAISAIVVLALALSGAALAHDHGDGETVTLEGKIVCAKCTVGEDMEKCQNVLVVEHDGAQDLYYLAATEANKKFGDVCMAKKPVRVQGTVKKEDGKTWIAASKIENVEKKG